MMFFNTYSRIFTACFVLLSGELFPSDTSSPSAWRTLFEGMHLEASYLYWGVRSDGFDYSVAKPWREGLFIRDKESFHDLTLKQAPGYRLRADFIGNCTEIEVTAIGTYFDTKKSTKRCYKPRNPTLQVSFPYIDQSYAELTGKKRLEVTAKEACRYSVFDLEAGQWVSLSEGCIYLRPVIGFRLASLSLRGKNKALFFRGAEASYPLQEISQLETSVGVDFERFYFKNRFKGGGIKLGVEVEVPLCYGWSIVGSSAVSLVFGQTKIKQKLCFKWPVVDLQEGDYDIGYQGEIKEHYRQLKPFVDISVGLRYETLCLCKRMFFDLKWEANYLFRQGHFWVDDAYFPNTQVNNVPAATTSWKKKGDLSLQGLVASTTVEF